MAAADSTQKISKRTATKGYRSNSAVLPKTFRRLAHTLQLQVASRGGKFSLPNDEPAMPYGMYLSAEGAQAQSKRLEVISNNLANVNTPGFKPDVAAFQARFAEAIDRGLVPSQAGEPEDVGGGITLQSVLTDFSPGTLKATGIPTDLAIDGEGFFEVDTPQGELLTRAGNFRLSPTGELQTQSGYPVLSAAGNPIVIDPDAGPWNVSADGGIEQAGATTLLALKKPQSLGDLSKVGENLFMPLARVDPVEGAARRVHGGYLELSGVNPTSTMMELIETSRAIEANMHLVQNQDHMLGTLISRVLQS